MASAVSAPMPAPIRIPRVIQSTSGQRTAPLRWCSRIELIEVKMIVANDVTRPGAGFDVDTNIVTLITKDGQEALPMMSKAEVAQRILDRALALRRE